VDIMKADRNQRDVRQVRGPDRILGDDSMVPCSVLRLMICPSTFPLLCALRFNQSLTSFFVLKPLGMCSRFTEVVFVPVSSLLGTWIYIIGNWGVSNSDESALTYFYLPTRSNCGLTTLDKSHPDDDFAPPTQLQALCSPPSSLN
jgi:hypothetical protein